MDPTEFDPPDNLSELERPLRGLNPIGGNLSRERMLFEAGRASAQADARVRFVVLSSVASVVVIGLAAFSFTERSKRHALELAFARLDQNREKPASREIPPLSIASNDNSPYSYRALSRLESSSGLLESVPTPDAIPAARNSTGALSNQRPLRVRDTGKLLQF
jgi:hypothetical protein